MANNLDNMQTQAKKRLINDFDIDKFAKAITHYAFRNGDVENMHANGQLSQDDMKILNKYMVNRIAGILKLIQEEQWAKLEILMRAYGIYGCDWDKAEPDTEEELYQLLTEDIELASRFLYN